MSDTEKTTEKGELSDASTCSVDFKSSVLTCYDGDDHCLCCRFIGGDRSTQTLLNVIYTLGTSLSETELVERSLIRELAWLNKEKEKWKGAYENMKQFAEDSGLDTTCYSDRKEPNERSSHPRKG